MIVVLMCHLAINIVENPAQLSILNTQRKGTAQKCGLKLSKKGESMLLMPVRVAYSPSSCHLPSKFPTPVPHQESYQLPVSYLGCTLYYVMLSFPVHIKRFEELSKGENQISANRMSKLEYNSSRVTTPNLGQYSGPSLSEF